MSCVSTRQMSWLSTRHMSCVSTIRYAQCSKPTKRKPQRGAAEGRPLLWRWPKAASFVLALNIGHNILLLRCKTCLVESQDICPFETQEMCLVESQDIRLVEMQDMCRVESQDVCLVETQDMCCVESYDKSDGALLKIKPLSKK